MTHQSCRAAFHEALLKTEPPEEMSKLMNSFYLLIADLREVTDSYMLLWNAFWAWSQRNERGQDAIN